jgi:hypothetical protein
MDERLPCRLYERLLMGFLEATESQERETKPEIRIHSKNCD